MRITFGVHLDGCLWSNTDSLGEVRVGPAGMLDLLEIRLALGGDFPSQARRVLAYMGRMQLHQDDWCGQSYDNDPWATTRQLLAWRDQLVEAGWTGKEDAPPSPRLCCLAGLEQSAIGLPAGRAERVLAVSQALREVGSSPGISSLFLADDRAVLPPAWASIVTRLDELGVQVRQLGQAPAADSACNLGKVQRRVLGEAVPCALGQDDTLQLVVGDSERDSAENIARFLKASPTAPQSVVVICPEDSHLLDGALRRVGLPAFGVSASSPWRAEFQLLPLLLATMWRPLHVDALERLLVAGGEFLSRSVRRSLLGALREAPGVGGSHWQEALQGIRDRSQNDGAPDHKALERDRALADAVDRFFCTELQDELAGATEEAISGRCRWLATQLGAKVEKHPALGAVIAWSSELNELVAGRKVVGRVELERMVQDIMGMGGAAPAAVCQVAPWQVLGHPGQLLESVDVVLWCGFDDNRGGSQAAWSRVELDWLARHGVLLDSPMAARAREASAWRRALLGARQGFVAFTSRRKAGEDCFQHPLWDEVFGLAASLPGSPSEGKVKAKLTRRSEQLLDSQGAWNLSGRSTQLEAHTLGDGTPSSSLPAVVKVPTGSITIKEKLSYSSAEMLLKCPLRWVLSRHAFLKGPGDLALPSGNGMLGTFFHFLAEQVFLGKDKKPCNAGPIAAQDHAGDLFDRHVGAMASELLLPENAGIRIATRSAMVGAMGWLAGYLESEKLAVESLEAPLFSPWHQGISLGGRVDMLLKDGSGGHTVLDHKWVRTSVYLEGDIKAKRALQLAIYTWAAGCELGPSCKAAYHLVKQQRCLIPEPNGLRETWEAADKALRANVDELLRGRVNIRQPSPDEGEVPAEAQQLLADLVFFRPKKGRCTYCSFTAICSEHQEGDK